MAGSNILEKEKNCRPRVSIIITTYNRPSYLKRAINSCLNQSYENIEVIVVDDNSDGSVGRIDTELVMAEFSENPMIIYVKHEKNSNGASARNTGILHSTGDFLTYLDDDDIYEKDKVMLQVDYLLKNDFEAVYCGWYRNKDIVTPTRKGNLSYEILSGSQLIYTNTIMIYRDISMSFSNWDVSFDRNQEAAYLMRFFDQGYKIGVVTKPLVVFDTSDRSNASNPQKNKEDFEYFLDFHKMQILKIKNKSTRLAKNIYIFRYRGVLLSFLKAKDFVNFFKAYFEYVMKFPFALNKEIIKYIFYRIKGKGIFDEY